MLFPALVRQAFVRGAGAMFLAVVSWIGVFSVWAQVAGCAQLLGIEDVSLATRPDAAPTPDAAPPPPPKTLMVSITGTAGGKITSSPSGIDCPPTCSAERDHCTKSDNEENARDVITS